MSPAEGLEIGQGVVVPLAEIEIRASRSGGPGGQHANVTASRIEAVFDVHGSAALSDVHKRRIAARLGPRVSAVAQDHRGQARNRELALARLQKRLAGALRPPRRRRKTRPTRASRERRLAAKRRHSERKAHRRKPRFDGD